MPWTHRFGSVFGDGTCTQHEGEAAMVSTDLGLARKIGRMLSDLDDHDGTSGSHSCRVSACAAMLARSLGLGDDVVDRTRLGGLVHDIGKLQVPAEVLQKKSGWTTEDLQRLRMHPITGAAILDETPGLEELAPIVLHHHERWDGRGYPTGRHGLDIPVESRVIFVADAFDAMTQGRYGPPLSIEAAVEEMERCAGWQFDPVVVKALRISFNNGWLKSTGMMVGSTTGLGARIEMV